MAVKNVRLDSFCPKFEVKKARDKFDYRKNTTIAMTDSVGRDSLDIFADAFGHTFIDDGTISILPSEVDLAKEYEAMIKEHMERRLAIFFQQLVACYETGYYFADSSARIQGDSPKRLAFIDDSKKTKSFQRNAAHSSTLPCLIAYDRKTEYEAHLAGKAITGFVFLSGSDAYNLWNATMNMPRFVNNADIYIDGRSRESKLRSDALELINQVARAIVTPDKAFKTFLIDVLRHIRSAITYATNNKKLAEKATLEYYKSVVKDMLSEYRADKDRMLSDMLDVDITKGGKSCRKEALQIRYQMIKDTQIAHARIIQTVERVKQTILASYKRSPDYFDAAFKSLILEQKLRKDERSALNKLLRFSSYDYYLRITKSRRARFTGTLDALRAAHEKKVQNLVRDVLREMRILRRDEVKGRSRIVKQVRIAKGWRQVDFARELRRKYPTSACSQSTISRIESGGKIVSEQIAEELAATLDIDTGLLVSNFFYSSI